LALIEGCVLETSPIGVADGMVLH